MNYEQLFCHPIPNSNLENSYNEIEPTKLVFTGGCGESLGQRLMNYEQLFCQPIPNSNLENSYNEIEPTELVLTEGSRKGLGRQLMNHELEGDTLWSQLRRY